MKKHNCRALLIPLIVIVVLFVSIAFAEENSSEWNSDAAKTVLEVDGTEGFEVGIGEKNEGIVTSDDESEASDSSDSEDETTAPAEGQEALDSGETLEGVIDVGDDYLHIRTGPWARIIGCFHSGDKVSIVSKEGDWFKILKDNEYVYIHSYYVDAPGFPSHQGVEPPSGMGSNVEEYGYSGEGGGAALLGYLQQAGLTGEALKMAWSIGMAESGGDPNALNDDSSTGDLSYGLFQINMLGAMGPERMAQYGLSSYEDLFDPMTNIRVMIQMSGNCTNWSPWSTYNRGDYEKFYSQFPG